MCRRSCHAGDNSFVLVCHSVLWSSFLFFSPSGRRNPHRDWNSHRHWSWPGLSSSLLLLPASVLLSATVLLWPVSGWVCGTSPGIRATGTRVRSTGSGSTTILLSTGVDIFDAQIRSDTTGTGTRRPDPIATIVGPAGSRPIVILHLQKGPLVPEPRGPFLFLGGE